MEEYLHNMKALRFQMNDFEDQTAKISVDELMHIRSIHSVQSDLQSAKSKIVTLKEETELMLRAKNQICSQILDKHKAISALEAEASTLSQTLELIQQERLSSAAKLNEKRAYYAEVKEELCAKLQDQQDWINSHNTKIEVGQVSMVEGKSEYKGDKMNGISGHFTGDIHPDTNSLQEYETSYQTLMTKLDAARDKLVKIKENNSKLVSDRSTMEQSIAQLQRGINDLAPEIRGMDTGALEEEHKALLSDIAGEMEYLQTLQCQIEQLKGISHVIQCACGQEYKVEMGVAAKTA